VGLLTEEQQPPLACSSYGCIPQQVNTFHTYAATTDLTDTLSANGFHTDYRYNAFHDVVTTTQQVDGLGTVCGQA
jgi:hypothetical protein